MAEDLCPSSRRHGFESRRGRRSNLASPAELVPTLRTLVTWVRLPQGPPARAPARSRLSYGRRGWGSTITSHRPACRPMGGPLSYKQQTEVRFLPRGPLPPYASGEASRLSTGRGGFDSLRGRHVHG